MTDLAMNAIRLRLAYEAIPQDRGGQNGPKGKARQEWIKARDLALAEADAAPKAGKTIDELTATTGGWWYAMDEEGHYHGGPLALKRDALAEARTGGYRIVAECVQKPVRVSQLFFADAFLEQADEANYDEWAGQDGDVTLDFTREQEDDLQAMVRAAIDAWQVKHQLAPTPYIFHSIDHIQKVEQPEDGAC